MKKVLLFLLVIVGMAPGAAFSANRVYDVVYSSNMSCSKDNAGRRAFCNFPNMRECIRRSSANYNWTDYCRERMCSGYSYSNFNSTRMDTVAVTSGFGASTGCWAYKCKSGYYDYTGKTCVTEAECKDKGDFEVSNGKCVAIAGSAGSTVGKTWCSDDWKDSYNSDIHYAVASGADNCLRYICKSGSCFNSATDLTCVPHDADNTFAGMYAGAGGICMNCPNNEYVDDGGTTCTAGSSAGMSSMKACFDCIDVSSFITCVQSGGARGEECKNNNGKLSGNSTNSASRTTAQSVSGAQQLMNVSTSNLSVAAAPVSSSNAQRSVPTSGISSGN